MPFEFAVLDWFQALHNPVFDAVSVFLNYAGEHGEIWIAFTLLGTALGWLASALVNQAAAARTLTR